MKTQYEVAPYRNGSTQGWVVLQPGSGRRPSMPNVFATEAAAQAEADRLNARTEAAAKEAGQESATSRLD